MTLDSKCVSTKTNEPETHFREDTFLSQWQNKFPGAKPPDVGFNDVREVEQRLYACSHLIGVLENKLNQKMFYQNFLQNYLNSQKKAHFPEKHSVANPVSSSFKPKREPVKQSPAKQKEAKRSIRVRDKCQVGKEADMKLRSREFRSESQSSCNGNSTKRHSKVLDNVRIFEAISEKMESQSKVPADSKSKISSPNTREKKTKSYIEIWECSTGSTEQISPTQKRRSSWQETKESAESVVMESDKRGARRNRHNYEEVWTCSSGEQVNFKVTDDTPSVQITDTASIEDYIEELQNSENFDFETEEMKREAEKKANLSRANVVQFREKPSKYKPKDRKFAVVIPSFQDSEVIEGQSTAPGDCSVGESDEDEIDSRHSSEEADNGEFPLPPSPAELRLLDTSPLLRLRRAQTTNERMSVAFSYPDWSDDDTGVAPKSPLYSSMGNFIEFNEGNDSKQDDLSGKHSANSTTSTDGNALSRKEHHKARNSTDSGATEHHVGSPQKGAVSQMVDYQKVRNIADAEKLTMRMSVLNSLLETEAAYLKYLDTLLLYMKPLKATIQTSQPVMSQQDFDTVFYRVPEIRLLHIDFHRSLKPRLDEWTADTIVGDLFKKPLSFQLKLYGEFLNNYKRAQHTVEKCAKENQQFAQIIESLKVKSQDSKDKESVSLIGVLYKPVERLMRTTLVLRDLLKHTPHMHPDFPVLREVLKQSQNFLDRYNSSSSSAFRTRRVASSAVAQARSADRELIKHGFLVEVASDGRKLRHCFLFSDLLLCAKPKNTAGVFHHKTTYECKWYIPLADLSFQPCEDSEATPDIQLTSEEELRALSDQAQRLKRDISREQKASSKEFKSGDGLPNKSRKEERLKKKLAEMEARMVLATPDLPFGIYNMKGKSYLFLMSSDYERTEWSDAILKQQESCYKSFSLATFEITSLLDACAKQRKMNNIETMLMREDEDLLSGYLSVNVKNGHGFLTTCNPYCTLEVDSYGQFQTKAKTGACVSTKAPSWNQEFELDVDGATTLRILCYDRAKDALPGSSFDNDVLIAKGKLELIKGSLLGKGEWVEESVLLNDLTIRVSVKFNAQERSIQRLPSRKVNGVFGVNLATTAKRDTSGIPNIVRKCVAEVERRGIDEVGIYRVSGVASEIKAIKDAFDTDRKDVDALLADMDINAVAGVLKLYFRELPEPLFTDSRYNDFIAASSLADPDTKQRSITSLLADLPETNYKTLRFLRQHLIRVANLESVNKMTYHNLATVFGPTLLRPAENKNNSSDQSLEQTVMLLSALRLDVHSQMDIVMYCLQLDDMSDYDAIKRGKNQEKSTPGPNAPNDLLTKNQTPSSPIPVSSPVPALSPVPPSSPQSISNSPTPSPQPRYHPYEEISIPPRKNVSNSASPTHRRKPVPPVRNFKPNAQT